LAIGSFQAAIVFTDNSAGEASSQQSVALSGTGVTPAPALALQPASLSFGNQPVGSTTAPQFVTLTNTGGVPLTLNGVAISGSDAGNFAIVAGNNPCPVAGGIISISATCVVSVDFSAQSAGSKSAVLQFSDNAGGSPQTVALSGTGNSAPTISVSPQSLDFGTQSLGVASAPQIVTLKNVGQVLLSINSVNLDGADPGDFSASQCAPVLAVNASCLVSVTMNPQALGPRSASLSVSDSAPGSPQSVSLSGQGVAAGISISPMSVSFPVQLAGTSSSPASPITVSNPGPGALAISRLSFSGNNPADFNQSNNCLPSVPPGGSCTIQLTFAPHPGGSPCGSSQQARCATMTLVDNAPQGSPNAVSLSGTAADFALATPLEGTTSATVTPGQTAAYNLVVTSVGYSGTVTLSCCSGLPGESTPAISPTTINLTSNATVPFQVNISTIAPSLSTAASQKSSLNPLLTLTFILQAFRAGSSHAHSVQLAAIGFLTCLFLGWRNYLRRTGRAATLRGIHSHTYRDFSDLIMLFALILDLCVEANSPGYPIQSAAAAFVLCTIGVCYASCSTTVRSFAASKARAYLLVCAFTLALILPACGGGNGDPSSVSNPGTPSGTFPIVLTATSQNTTRTIQLTLTVSPSTAGLLNSKPLLTSLSISSN
jgi:hypothetical protein